LTRLRALVIEHGIWILEARAMPISIAKLTPAAVDVHCEPFVLGATLADVSVNAFMGAPT
jgi:hypothetical protein